MTNKKGAGRYPLDAGDNREISCVSFYTEDTLIQLPDADYLAKSLGWKSVHAGSYENMG